MKPAVAAIAATDRPICAYAQIFRGDRSMNDEATKMDEAASSHAVASQHRIGRIAALILIVAAIVYGVYGSLIEYTFSSDPIGPRGFPIGLAVLLVLFGVWYFLRPGESEPWPERRGQLAALFFLTLSAVSVLSMTTIGFVPAMALLLAGMSRLFGATWLMAAVNGIGQALLWWLIFGPALGGNLPKGPLGF
jgi:putative tricarboxylic transport membrane protein